MIKVKWFRHSHEDRNDWLRFGLMELNKKRAIKYQEWEIKDIIKYGFSAKILAHPDLRHKSFLLLEKNGFQTKCLVDSEDSFVLFSELIVYVDKYFCAGYNSDVFIHKKLPKFYNWQSEDNVRQYKDILLKKIELYGEHFFKIKKFIPIAPNLSKEVNVNALKRRLLNLDHKIRKVFDLCSNYSEAHKAYKHRYNELLSLRMQHLHFDITLNDSLWGWPMHRLSLHKELEILANKGFKINSTLKYAEPTLIDNSINSNLKPDQFPISIGDIDNYESMLASSKLGVFACGFHWGWRNILSLALFIGIPVITDRLLTEAYFDMHEFEIHETEDESWAIVEKYLNDTDVKKWNDIKKHNQTVYDRYLSPEAVANYFITQNFS